MCKTPVTLGGGMTIEKASLSSGLEAKYFLSIQYGYHFASVSLELYLVANFMDTDFVLGNYFICYLEV